MYNNYRESYRRRVAKYVLKNNRHIWGFGRLFYYLSIISLENIVYFELLRRGYRVMIGKAGNAEVDFVAEKQGVYLYPGDC